MNSDVMNLKVWYIILLFTRFKNFLYIKLNRYKKYILDGIVLVYLLDKNQLLFE